jgi:hypothetical protein
MTDKCSTARSTKTDSPGIGKTAAKRRDQLRLLEEKRTRTLAQLNKARAELAHAVAEAEARERRRFRNQQMQEAKRLKFILGGLVLAAMRGVGPDGFTMSSQDLAQLREKERELLDRVWAVLNAPPQPCASDADQSTPPAHAFLDTRDAKTEQTLTTVVGRNLLGAQSDGAARVAETASVTILSAGRGDAFDVGHSDVQQGSTESDGGLLAHADSWQTTADVGVERPRVASAPLRT